MSKTDYAHEAISDTRNYEIVGYLIIIFGFLVIVASLSFAALYLGTIGATYVFAIGFFILIGGAGVANHFRKERKELIMQMKGREESKVAAQATI